MDWLTRSDMILLAIAAYVAVMALVRLMVRRRDRLIAEIQQQVTAHRNRAKQSHADSAQPIADSRQPTAP